MVAAPLPPPPRKFMGGGAFNFKAKIIVGGPGQKIKFGGGGGGGAMNPNDVMVVVLKDILLCSLGFRFIYIVYISWYYV